MIESDEHYRTSKKHLIAFFSALKTIKETPKPANVNHHVWQANVLSMQSLYDAIKSDVNEYESRHPELYPQGKMCDSDEGALSIAIGGKDGNVILDFGKDLSWIGLSPEDTIGLAAELLKAAAHVSKKPLTFQFGG